MHRLGRSDGGLAPLPRAIQKPTPDLFAQDDALISIGFEAQPIPCKIHSIETIDKIIRRQPPFSSFSAPRQCCIRAATTASLAPGKASSAFRITVRIRAQSFSV